MADAAGEHMVDPEPVERPQVRLEAPREELGQRGPDLLRLTLEPEQRQGERVELAVDGGVVTGPEGPGDRHQRRVRRRAAPACQCRELHGAPCAVRLAMVVSAHIRLPS